MSESRSVDIKFRKITSSYGDSTSSLAIRGRPSGYDLSLVADHEHLQKPCTHT